jgi:hypothetical protein
MQPKKYQDKLYSITNELLSLWNAFQWNLFYFIYFNGIFIYAQKHIPR